MRSAIHRYNSYGDFLRNKFGERVHKIPVNAGFTCPNRDGKITVGGCTYCNIDSFTPENTRARIPIRQQVQESIDYLKTRLKARRYIVYFQPYSNTYAPLSHLQKLYQEALDHPDIVGLSVGTRPDCMDAEKLDYFEELARDYFVTIEYGIESSSDKTLKLINRGHDFACTKQMIMETARRKEVHVCGHAIFGFPNETRERMLQTVADVSDMPIDFIKLHNLHVVRYTELARQYKEKPFPVFSFHEWVDFVSEIVEHLNPEFMIERFYGDAPKHLLIQPKWCEEKSAAEVIYAIQQRLEALDTYQGRYFSQEHKKTIAA